MRSDFLERKHKHVSDCKEYQSCDCDWTHDFCTFLFLFLVKSRVELSMGKKREPAQVERILSAFLKIFNRKKRLIFIRKYNPNK